jgi:hypothetical protein
LVTIQDPFNKAFFEFADRLVEKNAAFHHLIDEPFQLILHVRRSIEKTQIHQRDSVQGMPRENAKGFQILFAGGGHNLSR